MPPPTRDAVEFLESVLWAEVKHLVEGMGQIEGGAAVDLVPLLPVFRGDDALEADLFFRNLEAGFGDAAEGELPGQARAFPGSSRRWDADG